MKKLRNLLLGTFVAVLSFVGVNAVAAIQLGGSIFPLTLISTSPYNPADAFNQMLQLLNQQVAAFPPYTGNEVLSTNAGTNPLVQNYFVDLNFTSSSGPNAAGGTMLLSGISSRKIYPAGAGFTVMASGLPVGTTGLTILCSPSGNKIASIPQALLTSTQPVDVFYSSTGGLNSGGNVALFSAFSRGCSAGDSIYASTNNSAGAGPTTDFFINFPYFMI